MSAPAGAQDQAPATDQESEQSNLGEQILEEILVENPLTDTLETENAAGDLRAYFERFTPDALTRLATVELPGSARSFADEIGSFASQERTPLILQAFLIVIIFTALRVRRTRRRKRLKSEKESPERNQTPGAARGDAGTESQPQPPLQSIPAGAEQQRESSDASAEPPRRLWLHRSLSVAILAALSVTPLLIAEIPEPVRALFYLIAIGPGLRILGPRLHRKFRRLLYSFAGVLSLLLIARAFEALEAVIFPVAVGGMALAILLLPAKPESESRGIRLAEWYGRSRFALAAVFLAALAVDVAGYSALARYLGTGLLCSAAALPAMIAMVRVLHDLLLRFLDSGMARRWPPLQRRRLTLQKSALGVLRRLAILSWALLSLAAFEVLDPLYNLLALILGYEFRAGSFALSAGDIVAFAFIFWLTLKIAGTLRAMLAETTSRRLDMDRGASYALATVAQYLVIAVGFFISITAAGFDLNRLAIIAGALGVGIGLGLQDIVKNFVSGLVLLFERPITVGDYIEVDDMIGQVERIGIRSSTVRIVDGSDVIIPNGMLLSEKVRNWTLTDFKRRIDVNVGVAYGSDPKQVLALLEKAARKQDLIIRSEDPQVFFLGFGDSSLNFTVRVFTEEIEQRLKIQSELTSAVYVALNEAGVEIPFPQRDLHIRSNATNLGLPEKS